MVYVSTYLVFLYLKGSIGPTAGFVRKLFVILAPVLVLKHNDWNNAFTVRKDLKSAPQWQRVTFFHIHFKTSRRWPAVFHDWLTTNTDVRKYEPTMKRWCWIRRTNHKTCAVFFPLVNLTVKSNIHKCWFWNGSFKKNTYLSSFLLNFRKWTGGCTCPKPNTANLTSLDSSQRSTCSRSYGAAASWHRYKGQESEKHSVPASIKL